MTVRNVTRGRSHGAYGARGSAHPLEGGRGGFAVPRRAGFWLVALVLTVTMLGTTLPTPLYDIYQARWHFSAAIVTVTYAAYAVAVLITLLAAGRSSDQAGRKPVLAAALGASALSTVTFILAPDVGTLIAARIICGLSAGLMTGTATAMLTELAAASASRRAPLAATAANMGGLGLGKLTLRAFPALRAQAQDGDTLLTGPLADQAALYGVLDQIEALRLELLEVRRLPGPPAAS